MKSWFKSNIILIILCVILTPSYLYLEIKWDGYYQYLILIIDLFIIALLLPEHRLLNPIKIILLLPALPIIILGPLAQVLELVFFAILTPCILIFLTIHYLPDLIINYEVALSTKVYISLTLISIFLIVLSEKSMQLVTKCLYNTSNKRQMQLKLALSIFNNKRIRFYIYFLYFMFFIGYALSNLQHSNIAIITDLPLAIFYAFGTFIAFERITQNINLLEFNWRSVFNKYLEAFDSFRDQSKE